jgi:hypothetical protein
VNFAAVAPLENDATNDYEKEMQIIANLVLSQFENRTFSINDFFNLSRGLDIPLPFVKTYFAKFVKTQLRDGKIKEIPGVMDDPIFCVI